MEPATPKKILQKYWGYDSFRPLQEEIINSVLSGKDTLALLPTGGGKSVCFQVPALCQEGITLVISPLIALMKDQVRQLSERKVQAAALYSGMNRKDIDRIFDNAVQGAYKLLYLSPERLQSDMARERIAKMQVAMIAVDEAHCISQWGYDFRPPYLQIPDLRQLVGNKIPVIALTATATPQVVEDIQDKLDFQNGQVFQKSFARPNLAYVVLHQDNKFAKLLDILSKVSGSSIVYTRSRKRTEMLASRLVKNGISAVHYHAGLDHQKREQRQEAWIRGTVRVVVATNAFGMGIDKADVRTVIHIDVPEAPEAYFQEAGRAGRDGKKSFATLLTNEQDILRLEKFFELSYPPIPFIRQTYQALCNYLQLAVGSNNLRSFDFDLRKFTQKYELEALKAYSALKLLEQAGWIVLTEAVFVPSSLEVRVSKDKLYDFLLRNKQFDKILKAILRAYQGAFHHPVKIREDDLARHLGIPEQELRSSLLYLDQAEIVYYTPQKEQPQLLFLGERVAAENLSIDLDLYRFRKRRARARLDAMILYITEPKCRSQQLLLYFGESDPPKCGVCDVCLGRTAPDLSREEYDKYKVKIQRLLVREALTIEEIVDSFSGKHHTKVLKVIEYLLDEGFLTMLSGKISLAADE